MSKFTERQIVSILKFLGYKTFRVGYVGQSDGGKYDETEFQKKNTKLLDELNIVSVGDYAFKKSGPLLYKDASETWEDALNFSRDWNWLAKIAKKSELAIISTDISLTVRILKSELKELGVI